MNYKETYFWRPGPKFKIYFPIEMVPCISWRLWINDFINKILGPSWDYSHNSTSRLCKTKKALLIQTIVWSVMQSSITHFVIAFVYLHVANMKLTTSGNKMPDRFLCICHFQSLRSH
jgi:hypothetical protein